jgi:3-oxoacyl-[acyl-carrier protein] reductase
MTLENRPTAERGDRQPGGVLIIGGAGSIGRAVARRLLDRRTSVMLAGRDEQRLREAADSLASEHVATQVLDARQPEAVVQAAARTAEQHGNLDGVVNCAGSILLKPAHLTTEAEWRETLDLNLTTAFAAVRAAALTNKHGGSVVLLSSAAARTGLANHEAIAAAKAGVIGLTLSAAASYAGRRMRVNCVAPGLVDSAMAEPITRRPAARKASEAMHPLGRIASADEVASAISWLLDDEQSFITGQVIGVDGGLASIRGR